MSYNHISINNIGFLRKSNSTKKSTLPFSTLNKITRKGFKMTEKRAVTYRRKRSEQSDELLIYT
jgi:hypothetical protein